MRPGTSLSVDQAPLPSSRQLRLARERLQHLSRIQQWVAQDRCWRAATLRVLGVGWGNPGLPCLGDRFLIPVRDRRGALVNVIGYHPRSALKLVTLAGRPRDLWPRPEVWAPGRSVLLLEGEPDAITAASVFPLEAPIALPGSGWRSAWTERFTRFCEVRIVTDHDEAGRGAASAACSDLRAAGVNAVVQPWTTLVDEPAEGYDLTDFAVDLRRRDPQGTHMRLPRA